MQNIAKRADQFLIEQGTLLKKFKLVMRPVINFAPKRKTPLLSRIALWIVQKQGGALDIQFNDK